jgi:hypothetical protein
MLKSLALKARALQSQCRTTTMDSGIYDLSFYFSARSLCYLLMKLKNQDELLVSLSLYIMMRKMVFAVK